ncbi:hypothetical protein LOC71_12495 [Rhodopirellula sp. JC740]|uniref:Uncharacterized protein n=1 Tax=Rhodopirellula halodulae TaxID=2894198 RepID=A0ABS8NHS5_9BACT|nr:hypothetical protein [Rhodopirellula sp. JC740]MCC9643097.1 hypothetical protein [Rhodopirellula sp. JC740]
MANKKKARIPHKFLPWINIRKQYKLTHAEVQMARELGLEPRRFPSYADIKDQPWKKPLKEFIAALYLKQTGRDQPETIYTMEELAAQHVARRLAKKQAKAERLASGEDPSAATDTAPQTPNEAESGDSQPAAQPPVSDAVEDVLSTADAESSAPTPNVTTPDVTTSEPATAEVPVEVPAEIPVAEPPAAEPPVAQPVAADPPAAGSTTQEPAKPETPITTPADEPVDTQTEVEEATDAEPAKLNPWAAAVAKSKANANSGSTSGNNRR